AADGGVADTVVGEIELGWVAGEIAFLEAVDGSVDSCIDTFERTGDYAWVEVALVGVNSYAEDAFAVGGIASASATPASNLEDDVRGVLADLAEGNVFTLGRISEVL